MFLNYCTYAYLREDNTPYYIGKGLSNRPYSKNRTFQPPAADRILILKKDLSEEEAIRHEIYMISVFGRKDIGTGILRNLTNGGEGISGYRHTATSKRKIGASNAAKVRTEEVKNKISNAVKGYKWYNNGKENIQSRVAPGEGWVEGRMITWGTPRNKGLQWYHKDGVRKMFAQDPGNGWIKGLTGRDKTTNPTNRGKKWYNNGDRNQMFATPPEGWTPGMIRR